MAAAGDDLLCADDPTVPSFELRDERGDGMGGRFDRQGKVNCQEFRFDEGEPLTVFSFSEPAYEADAKVFPQHTILFANYRPEGASADGGASRQEKHERIHDCLLGFL